MSTQVQSYELWQALREATEKADKFQKNPTMAKLKTIKAVVGEVGELISDLES